VVEQTEPVGHAVRAMYMYSGMADVAALTGDPTYVKAIDTIWTNTVTKKLYVTGGIGASGVGEAFGSHYQLPNLTAYNEARTACSSGRSRAAARTRSAGHSASRSRTDGSKPTRSPTRWRSTIESSR
jgi:DUF1680 family protein